jgi:hypothetical protein
MQHCCLACVSVSVTSVLVSSCVVSTVAAENSFATLRKFFPYFLACSVCGPCVRPVLNS